MVGQPEAKPKDLSGFWTMISRVEGRFPALKIPRWSIRAGKRSPSSQIGPVIVSQAAGILELEGPEVDSRQGFGLKIQYNPLLGEGTFSTVNGNVTVTARKGEMPISASTLNGNVTVSLPGDFDGSLDAQTLSGSASSDFSVTLTETRRNNRLGAGSGKVGVRRSGCGVRTGMCGCGRLEGEYKSQ